MILKPTLVLLVNCTKTTDRRVQFTGNQVIRELLSKDCLESIGANPLLNFPLLLRTQILDLGFNSLLIPYEAPLVIESFKIYYIE
jgi:hypothetical protein